MQLRRLLSTCCDTTRFFVITSNVYRTTAEMQVSIFEIQYKAMNTKNQFKLLELNYLNVYNYT